MTESTTISANAETVPAAQEAVATAVVPETSKTGTASTQEPVVNSSAPSDSTQKLQEVPTAAPVTVQPLEEVVAPKTAEEDSTTSKDSAVESKESKAKTGEVTAAPASKVRAPTAPTVEAVAASQATTSSPFATPEKKAPNSNTSADQISMSQPATPPREGRVALILRINKELIRLCVDLQANSSQTIQSTARLHYACRSILAILQASPTSLESPLTRAIHHRRLQLLCPSSSPSLAASMLLPRPFLRSTTS